MHYRPHPVHAEDAQVREDGQVSDNAPVLEWLRVHCRCGNVTRVVDDALAVQGRPVDKQQQEGGEDYGEGERYNVEKAGDEDGGQASPMPVPAGTR